MRPVRPPLVLAAVTITLAGCASSLQQRTVAIAAANDQAKAAVRMEQQLDATRVPPSAISVLPFEAAPEDSLGRRLGFALAELLSADLAVSPKLQLVERRFVGAIVREIGMGQQGTVDARTAPRVGRLTGAWRTIIGTLARTGNNDLMFSSQIVEVVNSQVRDAVTATTPIDRIIEAEKVLALRMFDALQITLTAAQRARVEQRQTSNLTALLAFGRGLEAEAQGDAAAATAAFRDAARLDPGFEAARAHASARAGTARPTAIARVLEISTQGINATATTRVADVVDGQAESALAASSLFTLLITIRVF